MGGWGESRRPVGRESGARRSRSAIAVAFARIVSRPIAAELRAQRRCWSRVQMLGFADGSTCGTGSTGIGPNPTPGQYACDLCKRLRPFRSLAPPALGFDRPPHSQYSPIRPIANILPDCT